MVLPFIELFVTRIDRNIIYVKKIKSINNEYSDYEIVNKYDRCLSINSSIIKILNSCVANPTNPEKVNIMLYAKESNFLFDKESFKINIIKDIQQSYINMIHDIQRNKDNFFDIKKISEKFPFVNCDEIFINRGDKDILNEYVSIHMNHIKKYFNINDHFSINWITDNPGSQLTSSFKPVVTSAMDWYGLYFSLNSLIIKYDSSMSTLEEINDIIERNNCYFKISRGILTISVLPGQDKKNLFNVSNSLKKIGYSS